MLERRPNYRMFTLADDLLIIQQAQGKFSLKNLIQILHTTRDAVERRAGELGVTLRVKPYTKRSDIPGDSLLCQGPPIHHDEPGENIDHFGVDCSGAAMELELLRLRHPDRCYTELKFKSR